MTSDEWYEKGNAYRKVQDWEHAIGCYMEALSIDPESPAAEAKKMLDDILNYYHRDSFNP